MNHYKDNLNSKNIRTEFTSENTVYIQVSLDPAPVLFLCKFIKYDDKSGKVYGEIIEVEQDYLRNAYIGKTAVAYLRNCALYGTSPDNKNRGYFHWFNSRGYALDPKEVYKIDESGCHVEEHPSYGLISVTRQQSTGTKLFGSAIEHNNLISISINQAEHKRSLSNDWYHSRSHLINILMSPVQFAEMLTNSNTQGTPCTINYTIAEGYIGEPPIINTGEMFREEFHRKMHNFAIKLEQSLEHAEELLGDKNTKPLKKSEKKEILDSISNLVMQIKSNLPFTATQFKEQMDKVVVEAKADFEATIESKIRALGVEGFKAELKMLSENNNLGKIDGTN